MPNRSDFTTIDEWMNQAYSRLSTTHGHITDCKLLVCMFHHYRADPVNVIPTSKMQCIFYLCFTFSPQLLSWSRRPSSVRLSVKSGFSETTTRVQAKFYGKLLIRCISRPLFSSIFFFKIFTFQMLTIFYSFSLTWDPMGVKISIPKSSGFRDSHM